MYCPKCSSQALAGQRYCRNCGVDLGLIWDAMEGKPPGPLDFERLKKDLRELGSNLRTGFEEAGKGIKNTRKLSQDQAPSAPSVPNVQLPNWSREFNKALKKVKAAHARKYSLQHATLSILGGSAICVAWGALLATAAKSGLLSSIEQIILLKTNLPITGLVRVLELLWVLGLIPIARGIAHLINGIFFVPKNIEEPAPPAPTYVYSSPITAVATNEPAGSKSVTEDETLRFEPR